MAEWWSVEVFHGEFRASRWQQSYSSGAAELPEPRDEAILDLTGATPAGAPGPGGPAQVSPTA